MSKSFNYKGKKLEGIEAKGLGNLSTKCELLMGKRVQKNSYF
jgi:hypothetical protein